MTKTKYISPDGFEFDSYEDCCNDPDLDLDLVQFKLTTGERKPQNDFERRLLEMIKEAKRLGKTLEIYPN